MTNLCSIGLVVLLALLPSASTSSFSGLQVPSDARPQQRARYGDSWLDRTPVNWNRRMSQLPRPLQFSNVVGVQTRCRNFIRQPESPADQALVRVGWMMYVAVQSYGTIKVITAMSGADGMCRPIGYQAFVYWEGRYAGALAPSPMDSRTDGALMTIRLVSPTRILGEFARYNQSDPLCCPTRTSYVTYEVNRDDLPLVSPISVNTWPAGTSSEGPDADNVPSDALFGKRWKLTEVDGAAVRTTRAYIEFDQQSNRVTGDSGCNRIT